MMDAIPFAARIHPDVKTILKLRADEIGARVHFVLSYCQGEFWDMYFESPAEELRYGTDLVKYAKSVYNLNQFYLGKM